MANGRETTTSDIDLRVLREHDLPGAMRLKEAEGWNQTEADWRTLLALDPDRCLAAVHGGRVVGTVTGTRYRDDVAWVGMMLVDRNYRGLGLGRRLLGTLLEDLRGCASVQLDATDRGRPMYRKMGFEEGPRIDRLTIARLGTFASGSEGSLVGPLTEKDLPAAVALDRGSFGADRSRLIGRLWQENRHLALGIEKGGKLAGFVLGRPGSRYTQVGPMSAESPEEAGTLLAAALRPLAGKLVVVDVPHGQARLKERLRSFGFAEQRSFTRMYLHRPSAPVAREGYFLIAGPELG